MLMSAEIQVTETGEGDREAITTLSGTSSHQPSLRGVKQGWAFPRGKQTPSNPIANPSARAGGCSNHLAAPLPPSHSGPVSLSPWLPPCCQGSAHTGTSACFPSLTPTRAPPYQFNTAKNTPKAYPRQSHREPCYGEAMAGAGLPEEPTSPGHISPCDCSETGVKSHLQLNSAGGNSPLIITHSFGSPLKSPHSSLCCGRHRGSV